MREKLRLRGSESSNQPDGAAAVAVTPVGFFQAEKQAWERRCDVTWPCQDLCHKDYDALCPEVSPSCSSVRILSHIVMGLGMEGSRLE